ncbi:MAG: DUF5652 family protein [Patescibacteria group bacterium]
MQELGMGYGVGVPLFTPMLGVTFIALVLWSFVWKGLALWRAAKRGEKIWFVVFLIVNTAGILEIIYLFLVTKAKLSDFSMSSEKHG